MSVIVSDVDTLMPHTGCNRRSGETHVNQVRNMAVTNIVDSDTLYARFLCASCHLSVQAAFGYKEHSIVHTHIAELSELVLYFLNEKLRHGDNAVALFCFG